MHFFIKLGLTAAIGGLVACGDDSESPGGAGQGGQSDGGAAAGGGGVGGDPQGGAPSGNYQAVHDTLCAPETRIGRISISGFPAAPVVQGDLWDSPDSFVGPPELENDTCAFYLFQDGNCAPCGGDETCSYQGECVPQRRTIKNGTLVVSAGEEEQTLSTDATLGGISGELTVGDAAAQFGMTLAWGDVTIELAPLPFANETLEGAQIITESDEFDMPGALDATWDAPAGGGHVVSTIPINHHAAAATFTFCAAPAAAGAFHADAGMINPLAVITGLEFQGLTYAHFAAAETPFGCVEFQFGEFVFAGF